MFLWDFVDAYSDNQNFQKMYPKQDTGGEMWLYCKAHAALTAKTPYKIVAGASGWVTAAIATISSSTVGNAYARQIAFIGVPEGAIASSSWGLLQVAGKVTDLVTATSTGTVGHGIGVVAGKYKTSGAAYSGENFENGVILATAASGTTKNVLLYPKMVGDKE